MFYGLELSKQLSSEDVFSAIQSYATVNSTIGSSANVIVASYNDIYDPNNLFSAGIYTIPVSGWYHLQFWFSTTSTSVLEFYLRKNSSDKISENGVTDAVSWQNCCCAAIGRFDKGETVEVFHATHEGTSNYCRYQFTGHII